MRVLRLFLCKFVKNHDYEAPPCTNCFADDYSV